MAKGIFIVESRPSSPDREAEYNDWYDQIHLPEVVALPGFVSGRRLAPVDGDGPYVALYELDAEDLKAAVAGLNEAIRSGRMNMSDAFQMSPPPVMRLLATTTEYSPSPD
jgi:hypothetical protein